MHQHKLISKLRFLWLKKLHSIPQSRSGLARKSLTKSNHLQVKTFALRKSTGTCRKNLRYVSYSIPLVCIMLLLALGVISSNPIIPEETFALESNNSASSELKDQPTPDQSGASDTQKIEESIDSDEPIEAPSSPAENNLDGATDGDADEEINYDDLISPLSENSALNMAITNLDMAATEVPADGMAYRSHNVTVNAVDVSNYSLTLSYAEANGALRLDKDNNATLKDASTAGVTMPNMADDTWGWAWSDSLASGDEASLTYYGMPKLGTNATNMATGLLDTPAVNNFNVNFTKKLVFGAKFSKQAFSGTYHTSAILSLAAIPKFTVGLWQLPDGTTKDSGIVTMQSMTADVCKQVNAPTSNDPKQVPLLVLRDTRGGGYTNDNVAESYIVGRLRDGNCWMLQNMSLTNKTLTADDSDNPKGRYFVPEAWSSAWSSTYDQFTAIYYPNASNPDADTHKYGAYYTWCVATAGTCADNISPAPGSICPKGWKLPFFSDLTMDGTSQITPANAWKTNQTDATIGNSFGIATATNGAILSAAFFPAAGSVGDGSVNSVGSNGYYWSAGLRDTNTAYNLGFSSGSVNPTGYSGRYYGLPVRCVAPVS